MLFDHFKVLHPPPTHRLLLLCFFILLFFPRQAIALPPVAKWPYQNGFTFHTWLRMDPLNNINVDKDKPYLYWYVTQEQSSAVSLDWLIETSKHHLRC